MHFQSSNPKTQNKLSAELSGRYARVAELEKTCAQFEKMLQIERDRAERREMKLKSHIAMLEAAK